jgi:hypothetical protein
VKVNITEQIEHVSSPSLIGGIVGAVLGLVLLVVIVVGLVLYFKK